MLLDSAAVRDRREQAQLTAMDWSGRPGILLRIRMLGVRVPPSASMSSQLSEPNLPACSRHPPHLAALWPHQSSRRFRRLQIRGGETRISEKVTLLLAAVLADSVFETGKACFRSRCCR